MLTFKSGVVFYEGAWTANKIDGLGCQRNGSGEVSSPPPPPPPSFADTVSTSRVSVPETGTSETTDNFKTPTSLNCGGRGALQVAHYGYFRNNSAAVAAPIYDSNYDWEKTAKGLKRRRIGAKGSWTVSL